MYISPLSHIYTPETVAHLGINPYLCTPFAAITYYLVKRNQFVFSIMIPRLLFQTYLSKYSTASKTNLTRRYS